MSLSLPIPAETASADPGPTPPSTKRQRWFEVSLVMLVAFAGSILGSIYILKNLPGSNTQLTTPRLILGIVQEATALLLLGYVLSRTARRLPDIGFRWSLRDVALGIPVTVASYISCAIGYYVLYSIHLAFYGAPIHHAPVAQIFGHMGYAAIPFASSTPSSKNSSSALIS